jgi:hypothetical protein
LEIDPQLLGFQSEGAFGLKGVPGCTQTTQQMRRPLRLVVVYLQLPHLQALSGLKGKPRSLGHAASCVQIEIELRAIRSIQ